MKITINGSPRELVELLNLLGGTENEPKKAEFPPLLTELAEDEKINGLAEAIRNAIEENAPQTEAAEQSDEVGITKQSINNLRKMISEKTAEFFDEYVNAVSNTTEEHAAFNHCFYLRRSADEMWRMLSKSVIANIWDCDTLFL